MISTIVTKGKQNMTHENFIFSSHNLPLSTLITSTLSTLSTSIDSRGVFRTLAKYLRWSVFQKCLAAFSRAVKKTLKWKLDRTCCLCKKHLQHLGFVEKPNFSPLANHVTQYVCPYT